MVINLGIAGVSEGNGHPFSFSAIVNGYDESNFLKAGWPAILNYLRSAPESQNGLESATVTHAWTQNPSTTSTLCAATKIKNQCANLEDMIGEVDALIIARDDWENHYKMAKPFLEYGIPVFIDKPLSLNEEDLQNFLPYLQAGQLMTCSGFRYAAELSDKKSIFSKVGKLKLVSGIVVNDFAKYGIHLLEAVFALFSMSPKSVILSRNNVSHESYSLEFEDGFVFSLDCLGNFRKVFRLNFYGESGSLEINLTDNFSAFKVTIQKFLEMVETHKPPFDPYETSSLMQILKSGNQLSKGDFTCIEFKAGI